MNDEERACCACLEVSYAPIHNEDGTITERWTCDLCGCEFGRAVQTLLSDLTGVFGALDSTKAENETNRRLISDLLAERDRLRAENAALREALEQAASRLDEKGCHVSADRARRALGPR